MEHAEIAQYLEALQREDRYRIDATLKESPHEVTQRVFLTNADDGTERGPYVRKFIHREAGMGIAYARIYDAQQKGRRFDHIPNIIECYERDDRLVVVMELVEGETLQDVVYRCDPSVALAADVFPQICDAASELHEKFDPPIIHRDLKPSNVILSSTGLSLIDFGIARDFKADAVSDTIRFGTREFAPPEQFGFGQTTVRSDVYALGMVLYFCLTELIPSPSARESGFADDRIPERIRTVLVRATSFDPETRYESARALKQSFMEALQTSKAKSDTTAAKPRRSTLGAVIWNLFVATLTLLACIVSFTLVVNVPAQMQQYPPVLNSVAYGIIVPALVLGFGFACLNKTEIRRRFPAFANVKSWHIWLAYLVLFVAMGVLLLVVGYGSGAI